MQIDLLEEYLEKLYDDEIEQKIQATRAVSLLAEQVENIEILLQNESLIKYNYFRIVHYLVH